MNLLRFKPALLLLVLFNQTASPPSETSKHFRYERAIVLPSASPPRSACAILDAEVFAHAAPSLKDLRLLSGPDELPFTITVSEPPLQDTDDARILNLHTQAGHIVFDLEMPQRPYSSLVPEISVHDFIATAVVSGKNFLKDHKSSPLGTFTLFDLTGQHLARSIAIPLSESSFPYLHLELSLSPASGGPVGAAPLNVAAVVRSVAVPPSREAQSLYAAASAWKPLMQDGQHSAANFEVAARIPVERVAFMLPPAYTGDFSGFVSIKARAIGRSGTQGGTDQADEETTGTILNVHRSAAGHKLSADSLNIPVAIGSNMQQPGSVQVSIADGTGPVPPLSVQLQMRQRRICFDTVGGAGPLTLFYGNPSLDAPAYDTAALGVSNTPQIAQLGPETLNPGFTAAATSRRSMIERPVLRWIAILGCIALFALLAIRTAHRRRR